MHIGLRILCMAALMVLLRPSFSMAQDGGGDSPPDLTVEAVTQLQRELDTSPPETEEAKQQIAARLTRALELLQSAATFRDKAEASRAAIAAAPGELEKLKSSPAYVKPALPAGTVEISAIEGQLASLEAELTAARSLLQSLRDERTRREGDSSEQRVRLEQDLQSARDESAQVSAVEPQTRLSHAKLVEIRAKQQQLTAQLRALEAATAQFQAEREVVTARIDRASERVSGLQGAVAELNTLISDRKQQQVAAEQAAAARRAAQSRPEVRTVAEMNQKLAEQRAEENFPGLTEQLRQQTTAVQAEIDVVVAQLNYIDGQVQAGTPASIELQSELQKLRTLLRNPYSLRRELSVRREENRRVTGLRIRLEKERDELTDLNAAVGQELAQFSELSEDERVPVEAELAELFKTRREYLDGFLAESRAYLTVVREYSRLLESLLSTGDQARSFLGARGLLMQSAELPQVKDVQTVKEGLHWLSNVENLRPNLEAMLQSLRTHPYVAGVLLIFVLLLLPARLMLERRWGVDERHRIAFSPWALVHILFLSGLVLWVLVSNWSVLEIAVADHPVWVTVASVITLGFLILRSTVSPVVLPSLSPNQKSETMAEKLKRAHTFRPTLWAIFHTIVLSSYSAWVLWALGYMLLLDQSAPEYSLSVGFGLERAAAVFLLLNVIRQLCRVDGLADEHFEWPERTVLHIRKHLNWFILLGTILWFVSASIDRHGDMGFSNSLGRSAYIVLNLMTAVLTWRVFRHGSGAMTQIVERSGSEVVKRLRPVWYLLGIVIPVALAVLSALGWHYTSQVIATASWLFIFWVIGAFTFFAILERGWKVIKKRERYAEFKRTRDAKIAAGEANADDVVEFKPDLNLIGEQGQRLIRWSLILVIGLGFVLTWGQVFPAFEALDRVDLPFTKTIELTSVDGGGTTSVPLTLADVLSYILRVAAVIAIFYPLVRYLPAFLEITVLKAVGEKAGVRHAYAKLVQYLLIIISFYALRIALDISWAAIGVIAAPAGLALALSSQSLFGDILGGIRLYLTRPIRVGDVVKIDGVAGVVRSIDVDKTIVETWAQSECLFTNSFIVNATIENFTRSNSMNRHGFTVGIPYDPDDPAGVMEKAEEALRKAAASVEGVRTDEEKPPAVIFEGFGDNSINYTLYVYALDRTNWGHIRNEVPKAIMREFKARGLSVPFPQRDIHLDSQVLDLLGRQGA